MRFQFLKKIANIKIKKKMRQMESRYLILIKNLQVQQRKNIFKNLFQKKKLKINQIRLINQYLVQESKPKHKPKLK